MVMTCQTRPASSRAFASLAVAVLFVMQLALVGFAQARTMAAPGTQTVSVSSTGALCHSDDRTAPSHGDSQGCAHCVLCASGARNDLPLIAPLFFYIRLGYEDAPADAPRAPDNAQCAQPQGWTSTWSSRAPPTFS